ncbi:MAG: GNAT family N-acetyltransferase [Deltaproteobacteria bacterium]|jgi:RimJ/RimL family protein N-acetyltransferase|nr:GNAT family N-acetyltransferase [Deltaproteobacteria bacterium]MBW2531681.1 GNAT family N-acetyltransferase [Deltaproteobacteria bacterium]
MATFPKTIRLKGGDELTLRPCEAADEKALLEFFAERVPASDRRFLKDDVTDPAVVKRWVSHIDLSRIFPLLALHGDQVVGDATLHMNPVGWSKHVAEIRVVVAKDWQRKGIAQALTTELISLAHDKGLDILEAHVLEGQHAAQRALEAMGFHPETVLRNRAKDQTGRKRNILVMTNDVSELWRKMEQMVTDMGPLSGQY